MSKFGWCYIGCGAIANTTAKDISKSEDNRIVSVWNCGCTKAEAFAKKYGGIAYKTFEEAVNAPGVEGVYIALTADIHAEYVKKCIELHKPVMCEKPFTVSAKDAEEIFALAMDMHEVSPRFSTVRIRQGDWYGFKNIEQLSDHSLEERIWIVS